MPHQQRDVVKIKEELPDGTIKVHPFLIISCARANSMENTYVGVMMTASTHKDAFTFNLNDDMFESRLEKGNCQLRLYIVSYFTEVRVSKLISRMKKVYFKQVVEEMKNYVFCVDH